MCIYMYICGPEGVYDEDPVDGPGVCGGGIILSAGKTHYKLTNAHRVSAGASAAWPNLP